LIGHAFLTFYKMEECFIHLDIWCIICKYSNVETLSNIRLACKQLCTQVSECSTWSAWKLLTPRDKFRTCFFSTWITPRFFEQGVQNLKVSAHCGPFENWGCIQCNSMLVNARLPMCCDLEGMFLIMRTWKDKSYQLLFLNFLWKQKAHVYHVSNCLERTADDIPDEIWKTFCKTNRVTVEEEQLILTAVFQISVNIMWVTNVEWCIRNGYVVKHSDIVVSGSFDEERCSVYECLLMHMSNDEFTKVMDTHGFIGSRSLIDAISRECVRRQKNVT
jgi:hypothetical protein